MGSVSSRARRRPMRSRSLACARHAMAHAARALARAAPSAQAARRTAAQAAAAPRTCSPSSTAPRAYRTVPMGATRMPPARASRAIRHAACAAGQAIISASTRRLEHPSAIVTASAARAGAGDGVYSPAGAQMAPLACPPPRRARASAFRAPTSTAGYATLRIACHASHASLDGFGRPSFLKSYPGWMRAVAGATSGAAMASSRTRTRRACRATLAATRATAPTRVAASRVHLPRQSSVVVGAMPTAHQPSCETIRATERSFVRHARLSAQRAPRQATVRHAQRALPAHQNPSFSAATAQLSAQAASMDRQ